MKVTHSRGGLYRGLVAAGLLAAGLATWIGVDRGWSQVFAQTAPSGSAPASAGLPLTAPPAGVVPAPVAVPTVPGGASASPAAGVRAVQVYQTTPFQQQGSLYANPTYPSATYGYRAVHFAITSEQAQATAAAEQKTRELLAKYAESEDQGNKAKLAEQLKAAVSEQFEARQAIREAELKRLEEQLAKLKGLHDRRTAEKSQIIEDRVRQLIRDADGIGWGNDEGREVYSSADFEWTTPRYESLPNAVPPSPSAAR